MRALILSDIHSNLEALDAVLADAAVQGGVDALWFLGDLVGYGADPAPCIARLRQHPHLVAIAGNHDQAVTGQLNPDLFNHAARTAALWTAARLSDDDLTWLSQLPQVAQTGPFTMAHGSLRDPIMEYLISEPAAAATFARLQTPYCLVGHSHYPLLWTENAAAGNAAEDTTRDIARDAARAASGDTARDIARDAARAAAGDAAPAHSTLSLLNPAQPILLDTARRMIINPGSVGQPRDGDPRASYLIYDDHTGLLHHRRTEYNIAAAQSKIRAAGLPETLAARLAQGR